MVCIRTAITGQDQTETVTTATHMVHRALERLQLVEITADQMYRQIILADQKGIQMEIIQPSMADQLV